MDVIPDYTFPRPERLKSKKEITALFEKGKGGFVYPLRYITQGSETCHDTDFESVITSANNGVSVLVSVPKRNHKRAVVRNLLKRRMREAYRLNRDPLRELASDKHMALGLLYVSTEIADYKQIEHAIQKIIRNLTEGR